MARATFDSEHIMECVAVLAEHGLHRGASYLCNGLNVGDSMYLDTPVGTVIGCAQEMSQNGREITVTFSIAEVVRNKLADLIKEFDDAGVEFTIENMKTLLKSDEDDSEGRNGD